MVDADAPVRWGIIGASRIADDYVIPAIQASGGSQVVAVSTTTAPQRAREIADRHAVPHVALSVAALVERDDVDAVYVGSASDAHASQAMEAARAGKHVFCDKPLALTTEEARQVVDTCERAGVELGVNQQFRGAATHRAIQNAVREGAIGEIRGVRVAFTVQLPPHATGWRTAGPAAGVAMDLTIHTADSLRAIVGSEVVSVAAFGANHGLCAPAYFDLLFGTMLFDNGIVASFHDAFTIGHSPSAIEVFGSDGSLVGTDVMRMSPGGAVVLRRGEEVSEVALCHHDLYEPAVAAFASAVRGVGAPAASGLDGVKALQIAEAATDSATRGVVAAVGG